jgi:two-component system NtrC family sensor kinase
VRQLTEAAVHVAGGKYGAQVTIESNDEVGLLASSFNEMSRKMASDIERLRELNGHLIRAEKLAATGTLAAGVAHEVNNPLASISSLVQILQAKPGADTESREMFRLISTQIERISRVLKDLMEFARVRPASRIDTEINDLMKSSIRLASFDKAFALLSVKTSFDTDLPRVKADADQVQQVFLNLLFNARDAMPDGGNLTITTRRTKGPEGIAITFEDNGSGIAPEDLPRVFDPFFTTKFSRNGTGLGLAICYGIIAAHGGRITINSSPGNGTKIDVVLPVDFNADADLTTETETLTQLV